METDKMFSVNSVSSQQHRGLNLCAMMEDEADLQKRQVQLIYSI